MFNPHILVVKKDEIILGLEELQFDYTGGNYIVSIEEAGVGEILRKEASSNVLLEADVTSGEITVSYLDAETETVVYAEVLQLDTYGRNFKRDFGESLEDILTQKVYQELDNPKGSVEDMQMHTMMLKQSAYDKFARHYVENNIRQILLKENYLTEEEVELFIGKIYAKLYGMDILQELDDDPNVAEIFVNATIHPEFECKIYYVKTNEGKKPYHKTFKDKNELLNVFSKAISFSKKEINSLENAIIEAIRASGDRVNLIVPEASDNYVLNIRKFTNFVPTRDNMLENSTLDEGMDKMLEYLVKGKANIGIGGEMGTGKTTFINYLLGYTSKLERKVAISSVNELDVSRVLAGHDVVSLNADDEKGFHFSSLMKTALRTTADRIIIPESRGGEFKQVYEANLKTKGNMFTAHAMTDTSFLDVCADMYMDGNMSDPIFVKNKIAKSIDIIVIMKKINNKIKVRSISEVLLDENSQLKGVNLLYYWDFGTRERESQGFVRSENPMSEDLKRRLFEEGVPYEIIDSL